MKVKNKLKKMGNNPNDFKKPQNNAFKKPNFDFKKKPESLGNKPETFQNYEMPNDDFKGKIYELNELIPSKYKTLDEFKKAMHDKLIKESIQKVKENITEQDLISVYVGYLEMLDDIINSYFERVSEHFTIYCPEASIKAATLEDFSKIKNISRKEISKLFGVMEESMGLDLKPKDLAMLEMTISGLKSLVSQKATIEERIKEMAKDLMKNTSALAGEIIAAKLLAAAGSMKRLMLMPSSTIQVLGAEKALFRHLRSKAKPPKHGIIFNTQFVSAAPLKHRGKIARALASKIVISIKMDYYKGKDMSKELIEELNKKIEGLKK